VTEEEVILFNSWLFLFAVQLNLLCLHGLHASSSLVRVSHFLSSLPCLSCSYCSRVGDFKGSLGSTDSVERERERERERKRERDASLFSGFTLS
jgi:hypothetical protein